ncbi:RNA polymerase sigma-I factor [Phosphitispora sp. TUW77]|uniref:RNA polymerase sigma-I factor n=1 Tax=Phosphitispora sp. TUW77 TaxID=3152361 RepID=UPI003AB817C6
MAPVSNNSDVLQVISRIQTGDQNAREDFLNEYKPFIAKTAMNLCKRPLQWEHSDELSIALIAFNTAIDTYNIQKEIPFLPYAKVVINNRLKDLFRKESRLRIECSFDMEDTEGKISSPAEIQSACTEFRNRTIEDERREELEEYETLLEKFGVDFEALVEVSPKHKDSRQTLFKVAGFIAEQEQIMEQLLAKKQLPISELILKTGVNRKTLERGRKFIIATSLVLYYPMQFPYLYSHINQGTD